MKHARLATFLLAAAASAAPVYAQTAAQTAAAAAAASIEGRTIDGKPFQLHALKGKVVLVMFWSTGCAVCRDKMPELRSNYEGWRGKPFELVLVSVDRSMKDVNDYEAIISRTVPVKQRFPQLWAGEPDYRDGFGKPAQLPAAFLIDKNGRILEKYQGRVPAEAWDRIAELL
jgi:peroxiredoxin